MPTWRRVIHGRLARATASLLVGAVVLVGIWSMPAHARRSPVEPRTSIGVTHAPPAGPPLGLVDVKVAALDQDWSGLRLLWRRELRHASQAPSG